MGFLSLSVTENVRMDKRNSKEIIDIFKNRYLKDK